MNDNNYEPGLGRSWGSAQKAASLVLGLLLAGSVISTRAQVAPAGAEDKCAQEEKAQWDAWEEFLKVDDAESAAREKYNITLERQRAADAAMAAAVKAEKKASADLSAAARKSRACQKRASREKCQSEIRAAEEAYKIWHAAKTNFDEMAVEIGDAALDVSYAKQDLDAAERNSTFAKQHYGAAKTALDQCRNRLRYK